MAKKQHGMVIVESSKTSRQ